MFSSKRLRLVNRSASWEQNKQNCHEWKDHGIGFGSARMHTYLCWALIVVSWITLMCKRTLLYNCIPTGVIVHTNPLLHQNDPEMICSANRFRINPKAVFVCLYCSSEWNGHFHTFLLNTSVSIHSREAHPSVLSKKKCQKATNCQMIIPLKIESQGGV